MKTSQQILVYLLFLVVAVRNAGCTAAPPLECYSCNSFTDENCANIGESTPKASCAVNQTLCRKVEQHLYYQGDSHIRVFRQCATLGETGECQTRTGTYKFKSWYCHCTGALCNGSGSLVVPVTLTVAMILASFGVRKFL